MSRPDALIQAPLARARRLASRPDLRVGSIPDIQLIGGAGPYEVDVLIRVLPTQRLEIVGQVTHAERVHEPIGGLAVVLYDTDALSAVAHARTNAFGEFDLGGVASARYALALGEKREAPCLLVWEGGAHVDACETPV